jgi:hypothetical protein
MKKRKDGGSAAESRDRKTERIYAAAKAITETDAQETQAKGPQGSGSRRVDARPDWIQIR